MVEWRVNSGYSSRQQNMRFIIRQIAAGSCAGLMALGLAGCGDNSSGAAKQPPAKIQGELINPTASTAVAQPVLASAPAAVAVVAKAPEPKAAADGGDYSTVGF